MKTEEMIRELRRLEEVHKDDFVGTCETNWSLMCRDVANRLEELLAAQEPRVMTLEEYKTWIDTPFTERNPVFHEERTKRGTITSWVNTTVCSLREYGKNDRCWTSRPDEKTREETPWN